MKNIDDFEISDNDGRQWFNILMDGEIYEIALCTDGTLIDADGCPITASNSGNYYKFIETIKARAPQFLTKNE